jgi:RNA methyltransferase, TrmH family
MPKLETYHRELPYSYALGIYPASVLIEARPEAARRLLLHPQGLDSEGISLLRDKCRKLDIREEEAERVLRRESKKDNCFAAVVFDKYVSPPAPDRPHVVLCQISDQGNLGTALRACLAFGIRDVALIRPCVDAFDPHAVRASMGAFFHMNVETYDHFDDYLKAYPNHALYPFMLDGAMVLDEAARSRPALYALVFGNEAAGLPPAFSKMGQPVFIPQSREIDSLNLSVAVALGVYAFTRTSFGICYQMNKTH